nr:CoA transferase [Pseudomonas sp. MWU13-2105]
MELGQLIAGPFAAKILGELGIDPAQQADWRQRGII